MAKADFEENQASRMKAQAAEEKADLARVRQRARAAAARKERQLRGEKQDQGPATRVHVVKPGDSLSKIAKAVYGDAGRWPEILEANRDQIQDPNLIHPGQELRIP